MDALSELLRVLRLRGATLADDSDRAHVIHMLNTIVSRLSP